MGDDESKSGPGSRKGSEIVLLSFEALTFAVTRFPIGSINDIPCGDFNWIGTFLKDHPRIRYRGYDIVSPLIEYNKRQHQKYNFYQIDITAAVPKKADLLFSKELFLHLNYEDIYFALTNMKRSGAKYLMTSSHFGAANADLQHNLGGSFRPLDVCADPINLPEPLWRNKLFGLWRFDDILKDIATRRSWLSRIPIRRR